MERVCPICKETKDISEFRKNKYTKHGYDYKCKICKYNYNVEYVFKNRDIVLESIRYIINLIKILVIREVENGIRITQREIK